jgi:hypothetical protein
LVAFKFLQLITTRLNQEAFEPNWIKWFLAQVRLEWDCIQSISGCHDSWCVCLLYCRHVQGLNWENKSHFNCWFFSLKCRGFSGNCFCFANLHCGKVASFINFDCDENGLVYLKLKIHSCTCLLYCYPLPLQHFVLCKI